MEGAMAKKAKPAAGSKLQEVAATAYDAGGASMTPPVIKTKISSKNQITVPVAICRALDIRPGDEIMLMKMGDGVWLERSPRTPEEWIEKTQGSMAHVEEWSTKEKIDAWVRRERESWDRDWDPE
jgi:AbrB family looped-hinge helix DNA binding protein